LYLLCNIQIVTKKKKIMKLKFLFLGLLAMNIVACESYEESDSVAAMREARTEYIKAQTASENADAAYRNAQVKMQELNNALKEAQNEAHIQRAKNDVEKALLELAQMKLQMEQALINQKGYVISARNNALSNAYSQYTTAYSEWNSKSIDVLEKKDNLAKANIDLNTMNTISTDEIIPFLESEVAILEAELVAEQAVLADYKTLEPTVGAAAQLQEDKELEMATVNAEVANVTAKRNKDNVVYATVETEMQTWAGDNGLTFAIVPEKGLILKAADFNARKATLENDTIAPYTAMIAAKTILDAALPTDAGYNVLVETYNNAKVVFDAEKAEYNAFTEALFNAKVTTFNAQYIANNTMNTTVGDQLSALGAKIAALNNEITELQALAFVIDAAVEVGSEGVKEHLEELIENKQEEIADLGVEIIGAKADVEHAKAGSFDFDGTINEMELEIAEIEVEIAKLEALVVAAKGRLDVAEEGYKTLLED